MKALLSLKKILTFNGNPDAASDLDTELVSAEITQGKVNQSSPLDDSEIA